VCASFTRENKTDANNQKVVVAQERQFQRSFAQRTVRHETLVAQHGQESHVIAFAVFVVEALEQQHIAESLHQCPPQTTHRQFIAPAYYRDLTLAPLVVVTFAGQREQQSQQGP
jgi:hypothetical protein